MRYTYTMQEAVHFRSLSSVNQNWPEAVSCNEALTWPKDCVNGDGPLGS